MTKPGASPGPSPFHSTNKVHWIVKFIRDERVRQNLSQTALGERFGSSAKCISSYETGYCSVRAIYALEKIIHALGHELKIQKRKDMNPNDWLQRTAKEFPKTVKVSPDLKSSEIKDFFGREFIFARTSFEALGYCVLGFKDEHTLTAFCKKFAKHLISEENIKAGA